MPFSTEVMLAAAVALVVGIAAGYVARRYVAATAVKHAERLPAGALQLYAGERRLHARLLVA